jgi:alpha-glucosidase
MNEPAIFYTEDHLGEVFRQIEDYKDKNLDIRSFFAFQDLVGSVANHPSDYKRFFHEYQGQRIRHDKVHNLYGYYMTRAAGEAFERLSPEKRILLFSRSSYAGMHRYGGVWTGDNCSWWSHLLLNIQQMPGLNMCGFLYSGADTGGFGDDCTEDLLLRWTAFSLFTPLFRNHSAQGTRRQEPYLYGSTEDFRNLLSIRYALLPYIYSEFMKAALEDGMYMMPLSFGYPQDQRARKVEDQLLVGESLMIAPVYEQNARGRYVYLPERMKMLRYTRDGVFTEKVLEKGDHYVEVALSDVVFFLREGRAIPLSAGGQCVDEIDFTKLTMLSFGEDAVYEYYHDDGLSRNYDDPGNWCTLCTR